jgi:hypothetical protein
MLRIAVILVLPVFIALKLTGTVNWSWWWVMAPWWILALLAIAIAVGLAVGFTLIKWAVLARAWIRFRHLPEFTLANPAVAARIEAERPARLAVPTPRPPQDPAEGTASPGERPPVAPR